MKKINILILNLLFSLAVFFTSSCKSTTSDELKPFNFMLGNWQSSKDSSTILFENWEEQEGKFVGKSFAIDQKGDTVFSEKAEIFFNGETVVYAVAAGKQKWVDFIYKQNQIDEAIFENLEHDFPQRIIYSTNDKSKLFAKIEGKVDGEMVREYYEYKRN